jgi:hypothetical protein
MLLLSKPTPKCAECGAPAKIEALLTARLTAAGIAWRKANSSISARYSEQLRRLSMSVNKCRWCGRKFGLVRRYVLGKSFCRGQVPPRIPSLVGAQETPSQAHPSITLAYGWKQVTPVHALTCRLLLTGKLPPIQWGLFFRKTIFAIRFWYLDST